MSSFGWIPQEIASILIALVPTASDALAATFGLTQPGWAVSDRPENGC